MIAPNLYNLLLMLFVITNQRLLLTVLSYVILIDVGLLVKAESITSVFNITPVVAFILTIDRIVDDDVKV